MYHFCSRARNSPLHSPFSVSDTSFVFYGFNSFQPWYREWSAEGLNAPPAPLNNNTFPDFNTEKSVWNGPIAEKWWHKWNLRVKRSARHVPYPVIAQIVAENDTCQVDDCLSLAHWVCGVKQGWTLIYTFSAAFWDLVECHTRILLSEARGIHFWHYFIVCCSFETEFSVQRIQTNAFLALCSPGTAEHFNLPPIGVNDTNWMEVFSGVPTHRSFALSIAFSARYKELLTVK